MRLTSSVQRYLCLALLLALLVINGCGGAAESTTGGSSASTNGTPVLTPIGAKGVDEGSLLSFVVYASDSSASGLTFSANGLPAGASFNPSSKTFTWTPTYSQSGSYNVTFRVINGWSLIDEEIVTITVTDVNIAPTLNAIGNKSASESAALNFTVSASDTGGDVITYTATSLPSGASLNASSGAFSWTPTYSQAGSYNVTIRATDQNGLYDEEAITITVANTNRVPALDYIGSKGVNEMMLLNFTVSGSDPDSDAITYTATNLPSGAAFDSGTQAFSWTPDYTQAGSYTTVKFRVTDTSGAYSEETITVTVDNVNRTPTLNAVGNKNVNENALLSFSISGSDPDTETLTYSAISLPSGASLNSSSGAFSWTPSYTQSGSYSVTFRTSDIGGLYAEEPISITVTNVNRTPTFSPVIGNRTSSEASLLSFSISGTDPDSDAITYTAGNLPTGAVMTASSGAFAWTPTYDQSGVYPNVAFTVTDTAGLYTTEAITITVNNTNRAPVLSPVGNQSTNENQLLTFTISGTDPDGGSVTYTGISLPSGASLVSSTGVFTWTPTYLQAGTYSTVRFRASDIGGLYGEELITIVVTNVNVAPVLASIGNKTVNEGTALAFTASATDAGGDAITYTGISLPSGAAINPSSGAFNWTPNYSQAGAYTDVVIRVSDAGGLYDEEAITITVNNTNRTPSLNLIGSQNLNEAALLSFTVSGTDPDSDAITFTATGLPGGAALAGTSGAFSWTPTYLQAGVYNVTFRVTDTGGLYSQEAVQITVNNINRTPTLNAIGNKTTDEGVELAFTLAGTDPDTDDTLTYSATGLPTGAILNANSGQFAWTPDYVQDGVYNVTFKISDNYSLYDDEAITITVSNIDAAPTVVTEPASDIDLISATLNATVNPNEYATTAYFQWGISDTYGTTTTVQALGSGSSILNVSQVITCLDHNTTFYFRVVATNSFGTSYGLTRTFSTISNTNWAMIIGGETHTVGVKNDGTLWTWGDNEFGQLGHNDTVSRTVPTQVGSDTNWAEVACGSGFTIARRNNNTIWGAGDNSEGQLGLGSVITQTLVFLQIGSDSDWWHISAGGSSHCVALKQTQTLWTWGTNNKGQLGVGDYTNRTVPEVVSGGTWKAVVCGYDHTMAIASDGSLYAWGDNSGAQLGNGDYVTKTTPTLITNTPFADVAGGYKHTVAINNNGDLFAWGDNSEGELGTGDLVTRTTPTLITTSGWSDIEVGLKHTIARKTDGSLFTWGDNAEGQLGLGDLVSRTEPTLITGTGWNKISAGWRSNIATKNSNSFWAWGDNEFAQLGIGNTIDVLSPFETGQTWTLMNPDNSPSGRYGVAMSYDPVRQKTVIFGGSRTGTDSLNETWEWDGINWSQKFPSTIPATRGFSAIAYDPVSQKTIMFGGGRYGSIYYNDTWEWDGVNWTLRSPANKPSARVWPVMVYDSVRQRMVLFGGFYEGNYRNDTWEYDGVNWTQRSPVTVPPGRHYHAMAYDPVRQKTVLFGGWIGYGISTNVTWEYDGTNWAQMTPVTNPVPMTAPALVYDPIRQKILMFGSSSTPGDSNTWQWDGTNWVQLTPNIYPSQRSQHKMVYDSVFQKIFLFGGAITGGASSETWIWGNTSFTNSIWTAKANMPVAIDSFDVGVVNNRLYAIIWSTNEEYDPATNSWAIKTAMPTPRSFGSVATINNKIYVMGGWTGSSVYSAKNEEYNPALDTWATKADMPEAKSHFTCGVVNNKIYAIGGMVYYATRVNTNYEYDPVGDTWATKTAMPTARSHIDCGVVGDKIYVLGGTSTGANNLGNNEEYNVTSNTWATKASMPTVRMWQTVGVVNNKIYAIGGNLNSPPTTIYSTNEEYNPATNSWTTKTSIPIARFKFGLGVIANRIYTMGGTIVSGGPPVDLTHEYNPWLDQ